MMSCWLMFAPCCGSPQSCEPLSVPLLAQAYVEDYIPSVMYVEEYRPSDLFTADKGE